MGAVCVAARVGHVSGRHHVRRHRPQSPPGHGDLQRRLHQDPPAGDPAPPPGSRGCASGPPATRWGTPSTLPTPGKNRWPALWDTLDPAGRRARGTKLHELPLHVPAARRRFSPISSIASATASCCSCATPRRASSRSATPTGSTITASSRPCAIAPQASCARRGSTGPDRSMPSWSRS